jgi:hypothetical protein
MYFYTIQGACSDSVIAGRPARERVDPSQPADVNIQPLARSMYVRNVPQVVALPIADGHHPYLQWLAAASGVRRADAC